MRGSVRMEEGKETGRGERKATDRRDKAGCD